MRTPKEVQIALIALIKANPSVITPVPVLEVRESQWKGDVFTYPNIRVRVISCSPNIDQRCPTTANSIIYVYTEDKSSIVAETVAGALANFLHGKKFTSSGILFWLTEVTMVTGAEAEGDLVWRSEIHLRSKMA